MAEWTAIVVSALALLVSAVTAWLTMFRPGTLRMTQPTVLYLGPDGGPDDEDRPKVKLYLRTLLYSTSRRGQTVESMHVSVQRGETKQNFSIWVYGEERLTRGSGLYVSAGGVACNHHFILPPDGSAFTLLPGSYHVRVFAKRVSDPKPRELKRVILTISESHARALDTRDAGIYFDWGPDQQAYHAHVAIRKPMPLPPWLMNAANLDSKVGQ